MVLSTAKGDTQMLEGISTEIITKNVNNILNVIKMM